MSRTDFTKIGSTAIAVSGTARATLMHGVRA